jgi:hypothetical protein
MEVPDIEVDPFWRLQAMMQDYASRPSQYEDDEKAMMRLMATASLMNEWTDEQMAALHRLTFILLYERIRMSSEPRDYCAHRLTEGIRMQQVYACGLVGEGTQCAH